MTMTEQASPVTPVVAVVNYQRRRIRVVATEDGRRILLADLLAAVWPNGNLTLITRRYATDHVRVSVSTQIGSPCRVAITLASARQIIGRRLSDDQAAQLLRDLAQAAGGDVPATEPDLASKLRQLRAVINQAAALIDRLEADADHVAHEEAGTDDQAE